MHRCMYLNGRGLYLAACNSFDSCIMQYATKGDVLGGTIVSRKEKEQYLEHHKANIF